MSGSAGTSRDAALWDRSRRAILLATLTSVPIVFTRGFFHDDFNIPKLTLLILGVGLALSAVLIQPSSFGHESARKLLLPVSVLALPLLISWSFSSYRAWGLFGAYSRFNGLIPYLLVMLLGWLVAGSFIGRERFVAYSMTAAGTMVAGYALLQMTGLDPFPIGSGPFRVLDNSSSLGNTNFLGGFLAMALPVSIFLWVESGRLRLVWMVATAITATGLLVSLSQGGWAAAVAGTAVLVGSRQTNELLRRIGFGVAALVAAAIVLLPVLGATGALPTDTLPTATLRGVWWGMAIDLAEESPVVGYGPASFSIEATRFRPLLDVLLQPLETPDDPHSVPFAHLANLGALGFIGFVSIAIWVCVRLSRTGTNAGIGAAFAASSVAYLVQAFVSIDELALRVVFWGCLGAWVSHTSSSFEGYLRPTVGETRPRRRPSSVAVGGSLLVAFLTIGAAYATATADRLAQRGFASFLGGDSESGERHLQRAIRLRPDYEYRALLSRGYALAALETESEGGDGDGLIAKMQANDRYLEELPRASRLLDSGRLMHYWGHFDPEGNRTALHLLRRAQERDPQNVFVEIEISEVLIDLERESEALILLGRRADDLEGHLADFWAALALARLENSDPNGALKALEQAMSINPDPCRVRWAEEIVRFRLEPSRVPDPADVANLHIKCDAGQFQMFLDRLEPDQRRRYE